MGLSEKPGAELGVDMKIPTYDIFAGSPDKALWLEAMEGLGAACERMKERATEFPGPYFVFCTGTHKVLAVIDTAKDGHVRPGEEDYTESA